MERLISVKCVGDIPPEYLHTPIEHLFKYHNLNYQFNSYAEAQMLVGMCMDNRKYLHIPDNFAFIIRTGGANLRYSEFKVSYSIAVGGISTICLIAHNNCGMVNLIARKEQFTAGLTERAGWDRSAAEEHFHQFAPMFEIGNEIDFVVSESQRLRARYPKVRVVPLYYKIEDNLLYLIREGRTI